MREEFILKEEIKIRLEQIVGSESVKTDEPMSLHTTFRIGGKADYFVLPKTGEQIKELIAYCKQEEIAYYIIGNGSNLLVGDKGFRGVIIQVDRGFGAVTFIDEQTVKAQAGVMLSKLAAEVADKELTGFEFASGIPGTLGGAVYMNAGAYGGEIKDCIVSALVLDEKNEMKTLSKEELELTYRNSAVAKKGYIVLEAIFHFEKGEKEAILSKMADLNAQRREKQPLNFPSAGSTFKRPEGHFAGKLIMDAGLRGYRIGGAMVSEKHCGFVVNVENATAADVTMLMEEVDKIVFEKFEVHLEPEVRFLGDF